MLLLMYFITNFNKKKVDNNKLKSKGSKEWVNLCSK